MKKKKGFTLTELLLVIVILGILLAIAVPSIYGYLKKGKRDYYNSLENMLLFSGKDYLQDYKTLLPKGVNNVTVIGLKELEKNKYIDPVKDENGKSCEARVVAKKTSSKEYEYYTCLICENYQTEGEACEYDENNNVTDDTKNYKVEVDPDSGNYEIDANGVYIVEQGSDFTLPYGKAYYKGELVSDKVVGRPKIIDTNKLGTTKVIYVYQGAQAEITVHVVDRVKPSEPQVVLRKEKKNGNIYIGGWYSGQKIYEEFESTDYSKAGVVGSGIDYYEISSDGKKYTKLDSNNHITEQNGEYTYYVRSVDKSGNISDSNMYTSKIDNEVPSCSLEVKTGTMGSNGWYITDITIGFKEIKEEVSYIAYQNIDIKEIKSNTKLTKATGIVTDAAGNTSICSITVKVDKNKPTITAKNNGTTYVPWGTKGDPITYFNPTYSISGGSYSCTLSDVSSLQLGVNQVTCTLTGENGLTATTSTILRHTYTAQGHCRAGGVLQNNSSCYYSSNDSVCGSTAYDCNPYDCNPYQCNAYQCNPYTCGSYQCGTQWDGNDCDSGGYRDCGVLGYDNGTSCKCDTVPRYCDRTCYHTCYETCYNTCYETCYEPNSCNKTDSTYLYYTCPTNGKNTITDVNDISPTLSGAICSF